MLFRSNISINAAILSRSGFSKFFTVGGETPAEVIAGLQVRPAHDWRLDVAVGRGVSPGYGSTQFRAAVGLTWQRTPPAPPSPIPEPITRIAVTEAPDLPPEAPEPVVVEATPTWKEDELARVEEQQIVIRDPIQFELATAKILPESLPTLRAIAKLLEEHPEIAHIVIEGHASEEGSFAYNYDLSIRRSLAIFQELVVAGVYPARLSCRGMGEVEPVTLGSDEAQLAKNRRVIFHIVKRLQPGEPSAPIHTELLLPWNGAPQTFTPPPEVPVPPVEPEPAKKVEPTKKPEDYPTDPGTFDDDEEDDDAPKKKEGK